MKTRRFTMAQALVQFLIKQRTRRDGVTHRFIPRMLGIFGHGNVAGLGEALQAAGSDMPYVPGRNEQALVHAAAAFAKHTNRMQTLACTSSVGPGATNMITGAAGATINRVPVLLLPGDIFATRQVAPVLQQLESSSSQDISVNDAFRPVSRYWDRINRPEQLVTSVVDAMRVLTSVADTGAVTLCLPEDVQSEAWDYPEDLFAERVWEIRRPRPEAGAIAGAAERIRRATKPLIVAGGGVLYSDAPAALATCSRRLPPQPASRSRKRRPGKARSLSIIRRHWAPSAPRARAARTCSRARPT
jgi:3D-(3,5/4)-trihydroxycyclohexane-1,2-dione acylhydrolase (decyclizing)